MVASSLTRITTSCNLLVSNYLSRSNSSSCLFRKNKNHNLRPLCSYYRPAGTIRCCLSAAEASPVELTENKKEKKKRESSSSSSHSSSIQTTLTVWLLKQEQAGVIDAELAVVLSSISIACKQIASLLQRANISNLTGAQGTVNVQGEDQKKLDVISNEVFCSCLRSSGRTGIIASEEEDIPIAVEESYSGNYIVVFDPLDGSANIDCALPTGSIFGIYSPNEVCLQTTDADDGDSTLDQVTQKCIVDVCQPGSNLLAAGYCMYSSSVVFVLTIGNGVHMFTLDPLYGEFVLTHADVKIPRSGNIYAFNEGNYQLWDDNLKRYVDHLKNPAGPNGKRYTARYIGSLVVEIHRTLLYGGIYGNPWNHHSKKGKLRLLYECAPMSFIVEQAGGKGTNGYKRILDIQPETVHERAPIFIGSVEEVEELERYLLA